jgi:hypothetical protein
MILRGKIYNFGKKKKKRSILLKTNDENEREINN